MTGDQIIVVGLLGAVLALLIWGRWRYDAVAFAALMVGVIIGVVPKEQAFAGFSHSATVIIALVLVVSHGLAASGIVYLIARYVAEVGRTLTGHLAVMSGLGAALSSIMNNVGALALLMPVDMEAARKAKRSPSLTLMPLSFATILGGLVTLIGTPPNIIISAYREKALGAPYQMFDFAPVGSLCALAGVAFVTLIGWRLIPSAPRDEGAGEEPFALDDYIAELSVGEGSDFLETPLAEVEKMAREQDVTLLSVIREKSQLPSHAGWIKLQAGDILLLETAAEDLERLASEHDLHYVEKEHHRESIEGAELEFVECVLRPGSIMEGRTSASLRLVDRFGIWLVGVSRQGKRLRSRVRRTPITAGDVLLVLAPKDRLGDFVDIMSVLPLAYRGLEVSSRGKAALAGSVFVAGIILASAGVLDLAVALAVIALLFLLFGIMGPKYLYESVEWPVVILIGSLIPLGMALETSGATAIIARSIVDLATGLPSWAVLTLLMALTMTLSDVLNNTATAVIAAPIAVQVASALGVNPDPFLMAVAIAASCAFLTPIGHKNNTLIMGPGGYGFGDYWRMGLPLEVLVVAVAVPMILVVWPL